MIYLYLMSCVVCLAHVSWFRHNLASSRGELLMYAIVACVPIVNVVIVAGAWYVAKFSDRVKAWLGKPFA